MEVVAMYASPTIISLFAKNSYERFSPSMNPKISKFICAEDL